MSHPEPAVPAASRLYQDIVAQIENLIQQEDIRPGERLPAERRLAEAFGVSRNSLREAIRILSENGLLESRRGDGTYLRAPDRGAWVRSMARSIGVDTGRQHEIFEFRRMVEPQVAAMAAARMTDDALQRLKVLVCDQDRKVLAGQDGSEEDMAFHLQIARTAGNRFVVEVMRMLQQVFAESRSGPLQTPERKRASVTAHLRIIDALQNRNPTDARRAMAEHLNRIEALLFGTSSSKEDTE